MMKDRFSKTLFPFICYFPKTSYPKRGNIQCAEGITGGCPIKSRNKSCCSHQAKRFSRSIVVKDDIDHPCLDKLYKYLRSSKAIMAFQIS